MQTALHKSTNACGKNKNKIMPQLDKVSFLSQFFWLCIFFWGFYIVALKHFLPFMSRILKYRKKRLESGSDILNAHQQSINTSKQTALHTGYNEKAAVRLSSDRLLEQGLKDSKQAFKHNLQSTEKWIENHIIYTNKKELKDINSMYLHSLAAELISQKLLMQKCFLDFSNTIYFSLLKDRIRAATRSR